MALDAAGTTPRPLPSAWGQDLALRNWQEGPWRPGAPECSQREGKHRERRAASGLGCPAGGGSRGAIEDALLAAPEAGASAARAMEPERQWPCRCPAGHTGDAALEELGRQVPAAAMSSNPPAPRRAPLLPSQG